MLFIRLQIAKFEFSFTASVNRVVFCWTTCFNKLNSWRYEWLISCISLISTFMVLICWGRQRLISILEALSSKRSLLHWRSAFVVMTLITKFWISFVLWIFRIFERITPLLISFHCINVQDAFPYVLSFLSVIPFHFATSTSSSSCHVSILQ